MPEPIELLPPAEARPENPRWHDLRRQGVTASEIAVVMGLSKWDSPFNLYWSKVNGWTSEGNEYTAGGHYLEDAIADWWMAECDPIENLQAQWAGLYAHPDRPWQLATPDRLLYLACPACDGTGFAGSENGALACRECDLSGYVGEPVALLECKWSAYSWDDWGEPGSDEIPVYYRAQGLWQMDTLGVDTVHFAALGPGGFRSYALHRDERAVADLELMWVAGARFMELLESGTPPPLDSHEATLGALKQLHSLGSGDVQVPVELAERYRIARADRKAADERVNLCEAQIRDRLGDEFDRAMCGKKLVASRSIYRQSGDSAELTSLEDDWPVVDRLNPGRAESYVND
jgi:putative phage-type endonuclease